MNLYQYNIMEIKEIIDPLDKLKIRPNPKKFIKSVFFIDADKEDIKECTFTDKRENFKVNRTEILKNIMERIPQVVFDREPNAVTDLFN